MSDSWPIRRLSIGDLPRRLDNAGTPMVHSGRPVPGKRNNLYGLLNKALG